MSDKLSWDTFLEKVEAIDMDHWLLDFLNQEESDLSELLETGSVTTCIGEKTFVISLHAEEQK